MRQRRIEDPVKRFFRSVKKTNGCWNWVGYRAKSGYGQMGIGGKTLHYAHRLSWIIHFGLIPQDMFVCHKCDNRSCVKPSHLFLGTIQDNNADMKTKKRYRYGETHHRAKLNFADVREIRRLASLGVTKKELRKKFKVCQGTIWMVLSGRRWPDV